MDTVNTNQEIEKLRALNRRLYYYIAALLALGIASIVVNIKHLMQAQ